MATSNIDEVIAWLGRFADSFEFTRPGVDQSLGRDMASVVVERIMDRSSRRRAPDGSTWEPNSSKSSPWLPGGYKQWKEEHYGWVDEPNYRTLQMRSQLSLMGRTEVNKHEIVMRYGLNQPTNRSDSPTGYLSEADKVPTDLQKAEWRISGGARPQAAVLRGRRGHAAALAETAQNRSTNTSAKRTRQTAIDPSTVSKSNRVFQPDIRRRRPLRSGGHDRAGHRTVPPAGRGVLGVPGQFALFGGGRGRAFMVRGVLYDVDIPSLNGDEALLGTYADGIARTLIDTRGRAWSNVVFLGEMRPDAMGPRPSGDLVVLPYRAVFYGLT